MTTNNTIQVYTNEFTPEIRSSLDISPFSAETLSTLSEESLAIIREQEAYNRVHPPVGIFRFAAEGSQTRDGGMIKIASSEVMIYLKNDISARLTKLGNSDIYPDGTTTQISTGRGKEHRAGLTQAALVGRRLDNSDEVINTLQDCLLMTTRSGEAVSDNFLVECH